LHTDTITPETTTIETNPPYTFTTNPKTTPMTATKQGNTTITKTATLLTMKPTITNIVPGTCLVTELFVPEFKTPQDPFPIWMMITNQAGTQSSCNIPIIFFDKVESINIMTFMVNVTLDAGETREVLVEGISLVDGLYEVHVGYRIRDIRVS
jgi:hypothetical protein